MNDVMARHKRGCIKAVITLTALILFQGTAYCVGCDTYEFSELNAMSKQDLYKEYCKNDDFFLLAHYTYMKFGDEKDSNEAKQCGESRDKIGRVYKSKFKVDVPKCGPRMVDSLPK